MVCSLNWIVMQGTRGGGALALYSEIQIHLGSQTIHYVVLNYKTPNSFSVVINQFETVNF